MGASLGMWRAHAPYAVVFALLVATSLGILGLRQPELGETPSVRVPLPTAIAGASGRAMRFCQAPNCGRSTLGDEGAGAGGVGTNACSACGGALNAMTAAERVLLPSDVRVERGLYSWGGREWLLSVVVNGRERTGLHRPQMCLEGQGYRIESSHAERVELGGGAFLRLAVLELVLPGERVGAEERFQFAYWFTAPGRETESHWVRQGWMAADLLLHGRGERWSYVSLMAARRGDEEAERRALHGFAAQVHAALVVPGDGRR